MPSLYARYLLEHHGDLIIEDEQGFATYRLLPDGRSVYIVDIYVVPEHRKLNFASTLADRVVEAAKIRGCSELLGTVVPTAANSTTSLRVLLGYGMTLKSASDNLVVFSKSI